MRRRQPKPSIRGETLYRTASGRRGRPPPQLIVECVRSAGLSAAVRLFAINAEEAVTKPVWNRQAADVLPEACRWIPLRSMKSEVRHGVPSPAEADRHRRPHRRYVPDPSAASSLRMRSAELEKREGHCWVGPFKIKNNTTHFSIDVRTSMRQTPARTMRRPRGRVMLDTGRHGRPH